MKLSLHGKREIIRTRFHERWRFLFLMSICYLSLIDNAHGRLRNRKHKKRQENGNENEKRIVGGQAVTRPARYSYLVPILNSQNTQRNTIIQQYCIGTLVAPNVVLSAAHCQGREGRSPDFVQFNPFNVMTTVKRNNFVIKTIKIIKQTPHPNFDPVSLDNDLVLFLLSEKCEDATPIRLNKNFDLVEGETVRVAGWGSLMESGNSSPILRHAQVNYIPARKCNGEDYGYRGVISDSMICAAADETDACVGDSGGPLIRPDPDGKDDEQIGLVSWGVGCAQARYPGVYARIDYDWIESTICDKRFGISPESCVDGQLP